MKNLVVGLAVAAFVLTGPAVSGQTEQLRFSARVQLVVQTKDAAMKSEATSYINRELRSLGDVIVTDNTPQYLIDVLPMERVRVDGAPMGSIALSVLVTQPLEEHWVGTALRRFLEKKEWDSFMNDWGNAKVVLNHMGLTGPKDQLRSLCETLVAAFDSEVLEPERKIWQEALDAQSRERK